jgi:hypothetical protein
MASKNQKQPSTLEKFLKAKQMYDDGKYTSIEDAAKAAKISPATYYNYAKKVVGSEGLAETSLTNFDLPNSSTEFKQTVLEIKTLQQKIESLKEKVINMIMVKG